MADVLEKFSRKVDKDVLKEFLEERGVIVVDTSVFLDELFSAV